MWCGVSEQEENKGWVDIKRLAKDTHGFVGADLDALCTGATQTYLHRRTPALKDLEPGDITEEWLESLEVTMADFKKTLTTTLPSSVSSSAFHVTVCSAACACCMLATVCDAVAVNVAVAVSVVCVAAEPWHLL